MKALNLTNQNFGRLTAKTPESISGKRGWHCACSCGNTKWIPTFQLTAGHNSSCGCASGDISGQRFGKLIAVKRSHRDSKNRRWAWVCKCDCGNEKIAFPKNLQRGATVDCGCGGAGRRIAAARKRRLPDELAAINRKFGEYISNAKSRNLEMALTSEQAKLLFTTNCFYCGCEPGSKLSGIDRKNNDLGYTVDNSVSCCSKCNFIKNKYSSEEIIEWATIVAKKHGMVRPEEP